MHACVVCVCVPLAGHQMQVAVSEIHLVLNLRNTDYCLRHIYEPSQVAVSEIHLVLNLRNTEHFLIVVLNAVSYIHIYMNPNLPAAAVDAVLYGKRWPSC